MKRAVLAGVVAVLAMAAPAHASVLFDASADTVNMDTGFTASNSTTGNGGFGQNFLMRFTLGSAATLNGVDIYSFCRALGCGTPQIGTPVDVRIRNDVGGTADASNLFFLTTAVSAIDNIGSSTFAGLERVHADFSPVALGAGTYWIGMAGRSIEIGLNLKFNSSPLNAIVGSGDNFGSSAGDFTAAYRVLGNAGAVPEPAAWALMIAGFGLVGGAMRRRSSVRVTYA